METFGHFSNASIARRPISNSVNPWPGLLCKSEQMQKSGPLSTIPTPPPAYFSLCLPPMKHYAGNGVREWGGGSESVSYPQSIIPCLIHQATGRKGTCSCNYVMGASSNRCSLKRLPIFLLSGAKLLKERVPNEQYREISHYFMLRRLVIMKAHILCFFLSLELLSSSVFREKEGLECLHILRFSGKSTPSLSQWVSHDPISIFPQQASPLRSVHQFG